MFYTSNASVGKAGHFVLLWIFQEIGVIGSNRSLKETTEL